MMRGAVLGIAAVLITLLGHSGGHGALPETGLLALLLPLALGLGALVSHKRRSGAWILGFVLALQVLFHLLLTIAAGHGHHGPLLPDAPMLLGHLFAALAVAAVLTHGDALIHRWIAFWHSLSQTFVWIPTPASRCSPQPFFESPALHAVTLTGTIARRGPPVS
jgi:hypothetical protein